MSEEKNRKFDAEMMEKYPMMESQYQRYISKEKELGRELTESEKDIFFNEEFEIFAQKKHATDMFDDWKIGYMEMIQTPETGEQVGSILSSNSHTPVLSAKAKSDPRFGTIESSNLCAELP